MMVFFVMMLGVPPNQARAWSTLLVLLLASLLMLAALASVYKDGSSREVRPAKPKHEGKFIWASCTYEEVRTSQEMHYTYTRPGQAEWIRSRPISIPPVQTVPQKTCLCGFLPSS